MAATLLESRLVDLDVLDALEAQHVRADDCPPLVDGVCGLCDEPLTLAIIVPCESEDRCCDREVCLDCALRHGYPIR